MLPLTVSEVKDMNVAELRAELSARKLNSSGTKTMSANRLIAALHEQDELDRSSEELVYEREPRERERISSVVFFGGATALNDRRCDSWNYADFACRRRSSWTRIATSRLHPCWPSSSKLHRPDQSRPPSPGNWEKINTGEYVELSELLPSVSCSAAAQPAPCAMHSEMAGGPIRIVDSTSNRGKGRNVHDLVTWLEAYTILLHTIVRTAPPPPYDAGASGLPRLHHWSESSLHSGRLARLWLSVQTSCRHGHF